MSSTMQNGVPAVPHVLGASVADRIKALLARCDKIHRGADIDRPTRFNPAGQAHANRIAQHDRNPQ